MPGWTLAQANLYMGKLYSRLLVGGAPVLRTCDLIDLVCGSRMRQTDIYLYIL